LELDSQLVVRAINMESQLLNYLGSITADIKDLSSSLLSFLVKGIPIWARRCRGMLAVAHGSEQVLNEEYPPDISTIACTDLEFSSP
jgi:hypothetical protein